MRSRRSRSLTYKIVGSTSTFIVLLIVSDQKTLPIGSLLQTITALALGLFLLMLGFCLED